MCQLRLVLCHPSTAQFKIVVIFATPVFREDWTVGATKESPTQRQHDSAEYKWTIGIKSPTHGRSISFGP